MKIIKVQWKPIEKHFTNIISGHLLYNGTIQLLVDEIPEVVFRRIGNYFYGDKDGYFRIYKYERGSTDGFAGRTITLTMEDGEERDFKGSLWDPMTMWEQPLGIPEYRAVSITTEPEVMEKGFTFYAGYVTKELYEKLVDKLHANVIIKKGNWPKRDEIIFQSSGERK